MSIPGYIKAHQHCSKHRKEILNSDRCGCFYCCTVFKPGEIVRWKDMDGAVGQTAVCPRCGHDSVIGDQSGFPVTVKFLKRMNNYWY